MQKNLKILPGAWGSIATGIAIVLLASSGAFGQDRIEVERLGEPGGSPVFFIPGLATPGSVFEPYAASRPDLDAYLVTLAGFGGTTALDPSEGVILPAAQAVATYLEAGNLRDVVLVGHSLGGQVALQAALRAPDQIAHVVVVDSLPFFADFMMPGADPGLVRMQGEARMSVIQSMERSAFMAMIEQGAPIQATSPEHQAQVVSYVASSDQNTVAKGTFEALSLDWRPGLNAVAAPVTVLAPHNAFVSMSPDGLAARYAEQYAAIETLDVRVITDSRHFIMLDQPGRFADALNLVIGDAQ